jgi:uncharacterized protein (DUF2236 family)
MTTLLTPHSVAWRINREAVLMLGGRRALLMQIAHPLVAAAVADNSDFRRDPFGRLERTMEMMFKIALGSVEVAEQAYRQVDLVHARARGKLRQSAGAFPAGTPYDARDPELLLWVHSTLVDTAALIYRRFVADLTAREEEQIYQESKTIARLFKVPDALRPEGLFEFRRYMREMVERGPVRVIDTARELSRIILYPPVPLMPSLAFDTINVVTTGLLPPPLREQFGLKWNPARALVFEASSCAIRLVVSMLPDFVRVVPAARAAEHSGADCSDSPQ